MLCTISNGGIVPKDVTAVPAPVSCRSGQTRLESLSMPATDHSSGTRAQVLNSPILYLGKVTVTERIAPNKAGRLSGTRLKAFIFPFLYRLVRVLPVGLALLPARLLAAIAGLLYVLPNNPLRNACEHIYQLMPADDREPNISPRQIYNQFLHNALGVLNNFFTLYRHGSEAVLPRIHMQTDDKTRIQSLIDTHGGIVLAVPHNIASAFSALRIGDCFDMLLVAKNSPTIERTRIAIDFYERMQLSLLLVREGHPVELSRAMFTCLKGGKLVAATLDNIDRTAGQVPALLFGQTVGLSDWAARIAARMQVPVIPAYFHSRGKDIEVSVGAALVSHDTLRAVQHYASFFEQEILKDPASWAYLADKHWQKVLNKAVGKHPIA